MGDPVLIKKTKTAAPEDLPADLQQANANALADMRLKENSTNSPLYIVKVEDPTVKGKSRHFVGTKLREGSPVWLDLTGFEISANKLDAIQSFDDVENYVNNGESVKLINIRFPWTRVINIENRTFKRK